MSIPKGKQPKQSKKVKPVKAWAVYWSDESHPMICLCHADPAKMFQIYKRKADVEASKKTNGWAKDVKIKRVLITPL